MSLEAAGASIWTVMPKLVLRIGRSARRPLTGFKKTQAGTTPSSTSLSPSGALLKSDFFCWNPEVFSFPTTHQPSSNDCTTVSCSPTLVRRSSSGKTGWKSCLTLRAWPVVGSAPKDEATEDDTEYLFRPDAALMNEWRTHETRLSLLGETGLLPPEKPERRSGGARKEDEDGEAGLRRVNGLGKFPDWRWNWIISSLEPAPRRGGSVRSGIGISEFRLDLEKPLLLVCTCSFGRAVFSSADEPGPDDWSLTTPRTERNADPRLLSRFLAFRFRT